jgi:uncharacterized membrane protein
MSIEQSQREAPEAAKGTNWPIIIWALYIASMITLGLTMLIGAIIAYVKRPELKGTPAESHMTYAIVTFWVTVIVTAFGIAAPFDLAGVVFVPLMIWQLVRIFRGFLRAVDGKPIDKPFGLF